ncbi:MAG: aminotransferase [Epulopiscium sp.]|jgi:aminotransferase|uniref:Aminotransferase n=1 Tax=Defluviitalea raffinosedens TaxID=1450156 RepID=A0A7C8HGZ4_9FIRM|nr:aminotransferase class I/II-fold pyridoxal phosphate-dependent enzyme [Defluviitalea raffinosedens]KAE9633215.1 aminotransferase class I/II-fold pyridoxal phosphate-dependent enzyme [Defluviitalea raffinosedens]MBM7686966.1 aminotransferase [Defluviitalea raffinosedens]MDK2787313.1 aminotransferase [Candidatus Epulonipiscium sp.]HHW68090.1 aminotransferase class I/II-fold pyridoxal phosphate-dependent enzyme [Candidatus Epulonipiscium sp.]
MKPEMIASTVRDIPPSGIRKFFDIANEMEDAISLGVGEPDFDTPWHIREEGIYNLEKGKTVYTSNSGLMELREEISKYLSRRFSIEYNPKTQILVTVGASEGIDLALRALLNPGDEVLIPEPSYVSYKPCTIMAGGVPVTITTKAEDEFRLTPEQLKAHITDRTKVLILPYPNNPTGGIMEKEDLEKIADILRDRDIVVISDEIYAELTYDKEHVSIASIPGMYENTLVINGFSKAYAMTGWRLGYAAGPEELIAMMTKIHQYAIMCAPTTSQYAAVEALRNGDSDVAEMRNSFNRRRRIMVDGFRKMGMDCFEPLGAFYVFPSIAKTGMTSEEFCKRLLYEQKVAVVPGTAFGESGEGFIRCSYAYSIDNIKEALRRIEKFMEQYK